MDDLEVRERTLGWLRDLVVGQGLCPFARTPFERGRVQVVVSAAQSTEELLLDLATELTRLSETAPEDVETTLLVHPRCLGGFDEYNDFLDVVDALIVDRGFEGVFQVASFHPDYRFADTEPDAAENYTNRSPFPMLHLLREASVARAVDEHPDVAEIPRRNVALMRATARTRLERWRRGEAQPHEEDG
jgi:hypothetical protein